MAKSWDDELGILEHTLGVEEAAEYKVTQETLNSIDDQTFDRNEIIALCESDLNFLAAVAMPEIFVYSFPPVLQTVWQLLLQNVDKPKEFPKLALGIPRGHAKTTLIKLFILWAILFSKKKFILIIADTEKLAENIMSDVCDMLSEMNIKQTFGDWRAGLEKDTQTLKKFGFRGRGIALAAVGSEGSIRGLNIKTRECADSVIQSDILERWMIGTAMKAKSPEGCFFIFVGNMYPTPNSILKKLKTDPTWTKFINGAILADGTALWEELRSYNSLIEELRGDIAAGRPEIFFAEVLNDTEAGLNQTIDFTKFEQWKWGSDTQPEGKYIIIDPSQGRGMDLDAIGVFEVYDGVIGVKNIITGHYSPGNLIRRTLIEAFKTGTRLIAVEAMAYQYTLLYWFEEISKALGIQGIMFVPVYNVGTSSKNMRIASAMKAMGSRDIVLHPNVRSKVMSQIANWQPMKRDNVDDMLDVIAHATKVLADYPFDIATLFSEAMSEGDTRGVIEDNHAF